jgi:uncharacterized protein YdhG (YjbR/CyaY superfamily)
MPIVDEYLKKIDKDSARELSKIRAIIKKAAPDAEEAITYGVPGFVYNGHFFIGFVANKNFLSLYPASTAIEVFKDELKGFQLSKGAIRFTVDNPIPDSLLEKIISFRYKQVSEK